MEAVSRLTVLVILAAFLPAALVPVTPARAETVTGYVALDLETGQVLAAENADRAFIPASVLKVPSALVVLDVLGPDHRFATRLMHTGRLDDGVLRGDLFLVGGGDPTLDTPVLDTLADALAAKGVRRVDGRFLYDGTALPHHPAINPRQPPDASYNPGLGGLSLDFNRFKVLWNGRGPEGAELPLNPLPVSLDAPPDRKELWLPVRKPGRFAARAFRWLAGQRGVALPDPEPGLPPPDALELMRHESETVAEILRRTLFFSNNMAAETLALAAAQHWLKRPVKLGTAAHWLAERTKAHTPGVDWSAFAMPNASGLSDRARMTPAQCAALARRAATESFGDTAARALLPPLLLEPFGASDHRVPSPSPLRAKTGTMYYARALAGWLRTAGTREIAFCVMTDDQEARAVYAQTPFAEREDREVRRAATRWLRTARDAEENIVLGWYRGL